MRSIRPCQMLRPWRNSWWVHCYLVLWLFYQMTVSHTTQQLQLQKQQRTRTTTLLHSLENQITGAQVKRLDALQLSYIALRTIRENPSETLSFSEFSWSAESEANHCMKSSLQCFQSIVEPFPFLILLSGIFKSIHTQSQDIHQQSLSALSACV